MDIRFDDRGQFAQLAKKFRAAGKDGAAIRKALTATIQAELKKVVDDVQSNVRGLEVRGSRGRGSKARAGFDAAREMVRTSKAASKGRTTRGRRSALDTGLRERVAHSTKSKVSYTGFRMGARVYIDVSTFPQSQRKLPRYLNRASGWRHPVWGHRDRWVAQYGGPYFDRAIAKHHDAVRRRVAAAVNDTLRTLQR